MTGLIIRVAVFLVLGWFIYSGVRRIWRDWTGHFKADDTARHQRDLNERTRPDVIELKRDADGVYRPPGEGGKR